MSRESAAENNGDWSIFLIGAGILAFGLVMLGSATAPIGASHYGSTYYFLIRQILFGVLPGLLLFYIFRRVPIVFWERSWRTMLWVSAVLLALVFVPHLGARINNSLSWIHIGSISMQPAEIVKFTFIVFLSGWLAENHKRLAKPFSEGLGQYLVYFGVVAGLLMLQPDLGTTLVFFGAAAIMAYVAGAQTKQLMAVAGAGLAVLVVLIAIAPYRLQRITVIFHPDQDPLGSGYHIKQAQLAVGTGGVLGLGLGNSRQKFQYLPEVSADSIFAIIAEEMGFIVSTLLLIAYAVVVLKSYQLARSSHSPWARYFIIGTATWFSIQTFLNIGAMLGVVPLTGLPLPLVSHGGTSLMVTLAAFGVVSAIAIPPERRIKSRV